MTIWRQGCSNKGEREKGSGGKEREGRPDTLCQTPDKALSNLISPQLFLTFAKAETAAHLMHSLLWVTGLERGALSESCRNMLLCIPRVLCAGNATWRPHLSLKKNYRVSDSSFHFVCQLALWSWINHFNRDTKGDWRLLHSAIFHSFLARASMQQAFHVRW